VDPSRNLVYVRGAVPGPQGSFVLLRDAFRWRWPERQACNLPFPTHLGEAPPPTVAARPGLDPYLRYRQDMDYSEAKWAKTD
jgi:large subunit ribosomal protein L3